LTSFKILNWNAGGLAPHSAELFHYLDLANSNNILPSIICIQETHFNNNNNPPFNIQRFSGEHNMRSDKKGGGVSIFISEKYLYSKKEIKQDTGDIEVIGVTILLEGALLKKTNVYSIYLPPISKSKITILENLIDDDTIENILVGDFNAKSPLWGSNNTDCRGKDIIKFIDKKNLVCLNKGDGTRLNANGTLSHLDLALCSKKLGSKLDWDIVENTWGSDHYPFLLSHGLSNSKKTQTPKDNPSLNFNIKKADWSSFQDQVISLSKDIHHSDKVEDLAVKFSNIIIKAANKSIPVFKENRSRSSRKYSPFWNKQCEDIVQERSQAEKQMKKSKLLDDIITFRKIKARSKLIIKKAKLFGKIFAQNSPKTPKILPSGKQLNPSREQTQKSFRSLLLETRTRLVQRKLQMTLPKSSKLSVMKKIFLKSLSHQNHTP